MKYFIFTILLFILLTGCEPKYYSKTNIYVKNSSKYTIEFNANYKNSSSSKVITVESGKEVLLDVFEKDGEELLWSNPSEFIKGFSISVIKTDSSKLENYYKHDNLEFPSITDDLRSSLTTIKSGITEYLYLYQNSERYTIVITNTQVPDEI